MLADVYFQSDIENTIRSTVMTVILTAIAHGGTNTDYINGALATAQAIAVSFGIDGSGILDQVKRQMLDA